MSTFSGRWILTINLVLYVFSMWYLCIIRWLDWPRQTCYTCLSQALFAMPLNLPPSEIFIGEMRSESEPQKMDALSLFLLFYFNFISFYFVPFLFCFVSVLLNLFSLLACELVFQFFVNGIPLRIHNMLQIYGRMINRTQPWDELNCHAVS